MKKLLLLFIVSLISLTAFGQQEKKGIPEFTTRHKNIYLELLGSSIGFGVSFDMRINKGRMDGIGFRAGIGGLKVSVADGSNTANVGLVTFPMEFNHIIGKKRSSLITGIGVLPAYVSASAQGIITNNALISVKGFGIAGGFLTFGYRFQPRKNGFMFQIIWNPLINSTGFSPKWFGIGLGMGFK